MSVQDCDLRLLFSAPPAVLLLQLLERTRPSVGQLVATHSLQHLGSLVDLAGGFHHSFKAGGIAQSHEHAIGPVRGLRNQVVAHVLTDGRSVLLGPCLAVRELAANATASFPVGNGGVAKLHHQGSPGSIGADVICKRRSNVVPRLVAKSLGSIVQGSRQSG